MDLVRLLVALPALAACALLVVPGPELPSGPVLQRALMQASQIVTRGWGTAGQSAPDQPLRRVSLGGYDYGTCSGLISAVLLDPEPCDALWQRRPSPVQKIED